MQQQFNPNVPFVYGGLFIRPMSAQLTHDTDLFFKMDPFVVFSSSNGQKCQTQVCLGGGKKPHWKDQLELNVSSQDKIIIQIWDHNTIGSNEPVAIGELQVSKVYAMGGNYQDYVPLFYRGKPAGDLTCQWTFMAAQGQPQPNVQMGVGFGQQQQQMNVTVTGQMGFPQQTVIQNQIPQQTVIQTQVPQTTFVQQQSFPQQTFPQQGFPQQNFPQQTVIQTQVPQTTFVQQQTYPQQGFVQQQVTEKVVVGGSGFPQVTETITVQQQPQFYQQPQVYQQQPQFVEQVVIQGPGHHHNHHHHHNQGPVVVEEVIITQPQHHHHHHHNNW